MNASPRPSTAAPGAAPDAGEVSDAPYGSPPGSSTTAGMPILYEQIVALNSETHRGLRYAARTSYAFAERTNAIPLTVAEFVAAGRHYPIVFAGTGADTHCVAVLGLTEAENLFVDRNGHWMADRYVPAYVRRYPFVLVPRPGGNDLALCFDARSGILGGETGVPLFDDHGGQTEDLKRVLEFAGEYQNSLELTRRFATDLDQLGLLDEVSADIALRVGGRYRLGGLRVVSRRKLVDLTEKRAREFIANDYLELIYLHLASLVGFQLLVDELAARHPGKPADSN